MKKIMDLLSTSLRPAGKAYAKIMEKRRQQYVDGTRPSYRASCPVLSVGNISWGGTGKTPFTSYLLDWAAQKHLQAIVLTRGYGGKPGREPLQVDPQTTSPKNSGDEPLLLAKKHPQAQIIVFPERRKSAAFAEAHLKPDLLILDDGMQHLKMQRDLDIVLLSPKDLTDGWGKVIPSGTWREPPSALKTASCFAIKASQDELALLQDQIKNHLEYFQVPLFSFALEPTNLVSIEDWGTAAVNKIDQTKSVSDFILCSGVGNPEQVFQTAKLFLGKAPKEHRVFADHHTFSLNDVKKLLSHKLPVVCTAKDAIKLSSYKDYFQHTPLLVMDVSLQFGESIFTQETFLTWLENWWAKQEEKYDKA